MKATKQDVERLQYLLKDKHPSIEDSKEAKKILKDKFRMTDIDIEDFAINLSDTPGRDVSKALNATGFGVKAFVNSESIVEAVIKRCPKRVQDDRPKSKQQWCLFDSKGERLLGRHPTKEDALKQERVIQIHKHMK